MIGGVLASLLVLAATWNVASPDWTDCPAACQCKWSSGKKSAFCREAGFTTVPALNADIQVLDLTKNLIPHLSKDAFKSIGLLNLQRIFLRNTSLREIHPDAFQNLSILVEIDLSENKISRIHPKTFSGNERLRFLNLSGNPLTELTSSQFPSLKYLKTIELQHCNLKSVHSEAFINLPLLETLNMNSNRLKNISENVFKIIKKLKTLKLDNNPWRCDCELRDFRNWLLLSNLYSVPLTCTEPSDLAGLRWNEVPTDEFACGPTVTLTDLTVQEEAGRNVTFKCHVTGDPEPEVQWLYNGKPVNVTDQILFQVEGEKDYEEGGNREETKKKNVENIVPKVRETIEKTAILSIYNVSELDAGEYSCLARNLRGTSIKNATLMLPEVISATSLSKVDSWILIAGLAAGGVAVFLSAALAIALTLCLCGRKKRAKRSRRKSEMKGSMSFTEQEKKLLDVSITTTTDRPSNSDSVEQLNQHDIKMIESASIPLELCEPVHITIESSNNGGGIVDSRNAVPLTVPLTVFPPPPSEFSANILPRGAFGNIFISVSVSQEPTSENVIRYPDLLDIPYRSKTSSAKLNVAAAPETSITSSQSFATLPRRLRTKPSDSTDAHLRLGPMYDNMGPRVTAAGSSTLSLPETDESEIFPPTPPPPPPPPPLSSSLRLPLSVDYISL